MKRQTLMLIVPFLIAGCGPSLAQLRMRAGLDLECPGNGLAVQDVDPATKLVSGCGRRAIYVENFNDSRHPGWLLNSEIRPSREVAGK